MATGCRTPLPPPSAAVFTVFVDSSLGTHLAIPVSSVETVADLKRKITIEHALCFPGSGEISVRALKVKRRGAFYHLSDSMLVMHAFDGYRGTWFLHVDVSCTSNSKHRDGEAGIFVNYSREPIDEGCQLLLEPRLNVEEDLQLSENNISIDDGSNLHEKAEHIGQEKNPAPGSCQVESLIDASIGQVAAGVQNADEPMQPTEEHTEVFNNGGSLGDKETSNLENVSEKAHLVTDMDALLDLEEYCNKLPADDSSLPEHLTDDRKNKKKKKRSRSSKSQQTEVDSVMPLNNHHMVLPPTSEEQNIEHGCPLEKNDVPGCVPPVTEGNNEALLNNQKDLIRMIDDETKKTSENIVNEDSAGFDDSKKNVDPGFNSENMAKYPYSNDLSGTNNLSKAVEDGTSEVDLNCNPDAVIVRPDVAPITNEAVPPAEVNSQIPTNIHSKKRSSKRSSKKALGSNDLAHSTEFSNEENPKELLGSDHKYIDKESNTKITEEASRHVVIANLEIENPSADDARRSRHKKRRKSEKAASAEFQLNNHVPAQSLQTHTDKENLLEKLDDQKKQEMIDTADLDILANCAAQDSVLPSKPDHAMTKKEAPVHENAAILDTENPSVDDVVKPRHKRRKKSDKAASAECQPHEVVQSLQNLTNKENHEEKLDNQKKQELVVNADVDGLAGSTAQGSVFPPKPNDTRINKEISSHEDIATLDTKNPSADDAGRSCHKKRRKSEKAASADSQPNSHEPFQSLGNHTVKENLQEKLDEKKQQEFVVATESEVFANREALDSGLPPKHDAKSRRRKKKSLNTEVEASEATQQDFSHSLVIEVAEAGSKETLDDHHIEQSRQSELLSNHGEAIVGVPAKVNLGVSSGTNDKSRHHRKKKSNKSDLSYNTTENHDLIYSSECQSKYNFEKTSTVIDDPVRVSNDDVLPKEYEQSTFTEDDSNKNSAGIFENLSNKDECNPANFSNHADRKGTLSSTSENPTTQLPIMAHKGTEGSAESNKSRALTNPDGEKINFVDEFCLTAVQHESVHGHEFPSTEPEPKKQHKSKRKRKSSKHDATQDLVDPSVSDKQNVKISEHHTDDPGNQGSVDPIGKPDISHSRDLEKIQGNKPVTSQQQSVSQDEQSKHLYRFEEKTFTNTATKSPDPHDANSRKYLQYDTVQVKKNEIVNLKVHSSQSQSKDTGNDSHQESLSNPVASSDSTQENTPVQANKYKLAVRKVPNKSSGKIPFVTTDTIFDATSESSDGEFELTNTNASKTAALDSPPPADSDERLGNMQRRGLKKSAEEGTSDEEDIHPSQSSMSRKGMHLGRILRSTSSYKKAKVLASQSHAEFSESEPIDVVPETQPEID